MKKHESEKSLNPAGTTIGSERPVLGDGQRGRITLGGTVADQWPDFILTALIRFYRKLDLGDVPG